ncbi:MAG: CRISPR-associated protein Csm2 [Candidatus Marinimicrobia bacterium]|nr:CRISPR-associated protein Csm2 [Candidatus Neomarinimicrobiota bacterium]
MNGRHDSNRPQEREPSFLKEMKDKMPGWIKNGIDKDAIDLAEDFGKYLANMDFTNSQIRNIFGEIKRLEMKGEWSQEINTSLLLLRPKLAYSVEKQSNNKSKTAGKELRDILKIGINTIITCDDKRKAFTNFSQITEAILAYHKAFDGK